MSGQETGGLRAKLTVAIMGRTATRAADAVLAELGYGTHRCVRCGQQQAPAGKLCPPCDLANLGDVINAQAEEIKRATEEARRANQHMKIAVRRAESAEAERDRLREQIKQTDELLAAITLYITWRYVTRNLRTDQKDLFADAIERHENHMHGPDGEDPDPSMAGLPSYTPRWWRDDAALDRPQDPEDT